jgi:hypothetical protein
MFHTNYLQINTQESRQSLGEILWSVRLAKKQDIKIRPHQNQSDEPLEEAE